MSCILVQDSFGKLILIDVDHFHQIHLNQLLLIWGPVIKGATTNRVKLVTGGNRRRGGGVSRGSGEVHLSPALFTKKKPTHNALFKLNYLFFVS